MKTGGLPLVSKQVKTTGNDDLHRFGEFNEALVGKNDPNVFSVDERAECPHQWDYIMSLRTA